MVPVAKPSKAERLHEVHERAMREYRTVQSALRDERLQCLQDRRFAFIAGAQWEGPLGNQYANKPKFEVNKAAVAIDQIDTDYRNNDFSVRFVSKDGVPNEELADTCAALHRADEQDSVAGEAYHTAFIDGSSGGFGAWRLRADCERDDEDEEVDEDDEEGLNRPQRVWIEPIQDADSSVFFDLDAKRQDKSDAKYCFVVSSMTREEYAEKYPDHDTASWEKLIHQREHDWLTPDVIYVAEYYRVERIKERSFTYRGAFDQEEMHWESELEDDPDLEPRLLAMGYKKVRDVRIRRKKIHKYIVNGGEVMEDCGYIAGREIPVVPYYGKRVFVDNVERCQGHVRKVKDSQRIKNMQISRLAEISAYSPIEVPIFAPEQIKGLANSWAEINTNPQPFMRAHPLTDAQGQIVSAGPVGYTKTPNVPAALPMLIQLVDEDSKEILGNPDQGEKVISHVSGKAMQAVQQRVDNKSFPYIDNMAIARCRSAQIWLSMQRDIYVQDGRRMKGIDSRGQRQSIVIKEPVIDQETGRLTYRNDMTRAVFDVTVGIGPSSISRKEAATEKATDLLGATQDPSMQAVLNNFILSQMEGEGIEDIRNYARQQLLKLGVAKPTEEEAKALAEAKQNAQPSPNDQYLLAAAKELMAKAQNVMRETELTATRVDKTKAEIVKMLADIKREHMSAAVDAAERIHGMLTAPAEAPPGSNGANGTTGAS
jgi:hypothetical protein